MRAAGTLALVVCTAVIACGSGSVPSQRPPQSPPLEGTSMIEILGLSVRLVVRAAVIRRGEDLVVEATFTNTTAAPLVVNTWVLNFASLVLDLERVDGPDAASATPVPLGAPPTPPAADDTSGQVSFAPGESVTFVYEGRKFLGGQALPDAAYRVRLVYDNLESPPGEWRGSLETDWLRFQVDSKRRR